MLEKRRRENRSNNRQIVLISRGMLEFYADKDGPYYNKVTNTEKKIVVFLVL